MPLRIDPGKIVRKLSVARLLPGRGRDACFTLFIGDEGAILVHTSHKTVLSRQFAPDASERNLEDLRKSFAENPSAPVLVVIDTMDQSYIPQTLPPVSSISVRKLIKRRLDRDFGANDIKGAILLGRETAGRKDWNFLMVAVEKTRPLTMWIDFVLTLPNRFQGIYLASVETENILADLDRSTGAKAGEASRWRFFVSHNKVGGFRQVILRDGHIVFTRLAQPIGESIPEVIAGNIEQEMLSTIEYMKRLSFDNAEGLDITIIASEAIKGVFDQSKFTVRHFEMLTPYEMAGYLGIEGATQPTDQFGDVILAAAIGCSRKHVLTLTIPDLKRFNQLYMLLTAQRGIAAAAAAGLALYILGSLYGIVSAYADGRSLVQQQARYQKDLEDLREEIKHSNLDVEQMGDIMDLYQLLQQQKLNPLAFIAKAETVIKAPIVVRAVEWSVADDKTAAASKAKTPKPKMTAVFTLELPGVANLDAFKVVSKQVLGDLKAIFKGYDVAFTKLPSQFSETEKLDMTFEGAAERPRQENNQAQDVQLTIKEL